MKIPDRPGEGSLGSERETSALAEAVDRIAHQLKNPLQAMTVNLEVIRLHARKGEADELERVAGVVDENIQLLDRRIRMLIALARRSPEEPATGLDLGQLVREAGGAFRLDEREDGSGLRLRVPGREAAGEGLAVRAREGELLALILAAASRASEVGTAAEVPYLAVDPVESGARLEVGPGGPWRGQDERDEMLAQARRAGGEVSTTGDETGPGAGGPFRVRFPRP